MEANHVCVPWRGRGGRIGDCIHCGDRVGDRVTYRLGDLQEGKRYHYLSAVSGEVGLGVLWFERVNGKRVYYYQLGDEVQEAHPSDLNMFVGS